MKEYNMCPIYKIYNEVAIQVAIECGGEYVNNERTERKLIHYVLNALSLNVKPIVDRFNELISQKLKNVSKR